MIPSRSLLEEEAPQLTDPKPHSPALLQSPAPWRRKAWKSPPRERGPHPSLFRPTRALEGRPRFHQASGLVRIRRHLPRAGIDDGHEH